jgi:hypothetical protein
MLDVIQIIQRVAASGELVKVLDKPCLDLTARSLRMSASGS